MAQDNYKGLCVRIPSALRRRIDRISKLRMKTPSELAREALLEYTERRERELNVKGAA